MKYLMGADGGGTKTAFLVTDLEGNVISELKKGRSNPNDIGIENTISLVVDGFTLLCNQAGIDKSEVAAIFAGMAGVTANGYRDVIRTAVQNEFPNALVGVNHDGVNILYAAFPESDGVGVICGTGTSCFVKKDDVLHRIGGYGLFDLYGGGYEIGRAAISHALRSIDGRDEKSILSEMVKEKAGFDLIENLSTLISSGKNNIATYALLVYEAYKQSDKYAAEILDVHTGYLAELINTAAKHFKGSYKVSLAGSIGKDPVTMEILAPKLVPEAIVSALDCEPIFGAVARAKVLLTKGK
jgi:N-acetylglucosamine kinase-like BadF-type ATPase